MNFVHRAAAAAALPLALAGCSGTPSSTASASPTATVAAPASAAPAMVAGTPTPTGPVVTPYGQTVTLDSGVSVTCKRPRRFTPSATALPVPAGDVALYVRCTLTAGSAAVDPNGVRAVLVLDGVQGDPASDAESGMYQPARVDVAGMPAALFGDA